ncbi:hypothetical protein GIB67_026383, partial [Kingdonia uniflora]
APKYFYLSLSLSLSRLQAAASERYGSKMLVRDDNALVKPCNPSLFLNSVWTQNMPDTMKEVWRKYLMQLQNYPLRTTVSSFLQTSIDNFDCLAGCSGTIAQKISGIKKLQLRRLLLIMEFKMIEVVNSEIAVEAVAMNQSRINPKLERIEDTKQLNQTHSTKISDVSNFLELIKSLAKLALEGWANPGQGCAEANKSFMYSKASNPSVRSTSVIFHLDAK